MDPYTALDFLWSASVARGTERAYLSGFCAYVKFLLLCGMVACVPEGACPPIDEDLLMLFVSYCYSTLNISYATTKLYLCGIRHFCIRRGHRYIKIDADSAPRLAAIMNGFKRSKLSTNSLVRMPITADILFKLCCHWMAGYFNNFLDLMMQTACIFAYYGFLRCGEFTVMKDFDHAVNLCLTDLCLLADRVLITLKQSKTDPFRTGVQLVLFKQQKGRLCPVRIATEYLLARQKLWSTANPNTEPLFIVNTYGAPLTREFFISSLRQTLDTLGIESSRYYGHSFRIGAATSAAASRVEDHLIKALGRWKSDSYCRYIKIDPNSIRLAQESMAL